ncbi:MAG TPA: hypothetical protein QGH10_07065 [Armatimonadota bacterium]|nr:hypothetical protein [Armatimonadota bacterium]
MSERPQRPWLWQILVPAGIGALGGVAACVTFRTPLTSLCSYVAAGASVGFALGAAMASLALRRRQVSAPVGCGIVALYPIVGFAALLAARGWLVAWAAPDWMVVLAWGR